MTALPDAAKYVIIGAGVHGLSTAWHLAMQMKEAGAGSGADIVLLDIHLPDTDGFHVCKEIREFSDVPVVMLSARDAEVDKVRGLEMGADDYITKPFSHLELLARVRAVMRRYESQLPAVGEMFESGGLSIDYASRTVTVEGTVVRLTPTEYSLLYHLSQIGRAHV